MKQRLVPLKLNCTISSFNDSISMLLTKTRFSDGKSNLSSGGGSFESELNRMGWSGAPARPVGYWTLVLSFLSVKRRRNEPFVVGHLTRVMTPRRHQQQKMSVPLIVDDQEADDPTNVWFDRFLGVIKWVDFIDLLNSRWCVWLLYNIIFIPSFLWESSNNYILSINNCFIYIHLFLFFVFPVNRYLLLSIR